MMVDRTKMVTVGVVRRGQILDIYEVEMTEFPDRLVMRYERDK